MNTSVKNPVNFDIYQVVSDAIINQIETGTPPWKKPVLTVRFEDGTTFNRPCNFVTKRPYEGINTFLLSCTPHTIPMFLTFNQVQALKASVKKGAKGYIVVFWNKETFTEIGEDGKEKEKSRFFLKYHKVFNVEDTTLDYEKYIVREDAKPKKEAVRIQACEDIIKSYVNPPKIVTTETDMCYFPISDKIAIPAFTRFKKGSEYYHVLFHEMIHSTGHRSRLNREGIEEFKGFGSASYSKEELIAELGAAFLEKMAGIDTPEMLTNSAAYIKGWLKPLKEDKKFFFEACSKATKAVEYILGTF
ncbi:zincin-like metallopeptidase domain-containing protein [Runella sp. MFBS21]|uniref:ArdC family protein n=1 Tax=Runella sp. MFBS21 TaxID=3034018 RepID=UPI0023F6D9B5|nr:zincin-like metallopeptidase domain-containing protein [Runella sp. MFBS21]MDF7821802.1 zincin-like metallopeptidase domain-containing protein [Runella sp. MFBS21]